jgi:hypothetical protein
VNRGSVSSSRKTEGNQVVCNRFAQKNKTLLRMYRLFRVGEMPTTRIEAFSDGVFAVIIALLVLEIHVPQVQGKDISASLAHSLLAMAPKFRPTY